MSVEWSWVSRQLADSSKNVNEATVAALKAFDDAAEKHMLTDDERREVLSKLHSLALGYALVETKPGEKWEAVVPGEYNIGDTVRVRADAYKGSHALRHNGKRGRVAAVHQSKTVVIYDDAKSSEESFYHEPGKLERLL